MYVFIHNVILTHLVGAGGGEGVAYELRSSLDGSTWEHVASSSTGVCMCRYMHVYIGRTSLLRLQVSVCIHTYMYTCKHIYVYVQHLEARRIFAFRCLCVYIYMYTYIHIYVYMY